MKKRVSKHTPFTQWNQDRPRMAFQLALLGTTEREMAEVMGVKKETLEYWKRNKGVFLKELEKGRKIADAKVAEGLYINCFDRYVEIEEVHLYKGQEIRTKRKQFIQGDKAAQAKWLALRQKGNWSERQNNVSLNQTNINIGNMDLSILSSTELEALSKVGLPQIIQDGGDEHNR